MKISKKKVATIAFTLPILLCSVSTFAHEHKGRKGYEHHHIMKFLFKDVELTEEQRERIIAFHNEERQHRNNNMKNRIKNAREAQKKVQEFVLSDYFDEEAVRIFANEMTNKQIEERVERMRRQNEMFSILTAEQKEQVKENMDNRTKKMVN